MRRWSPFALLIAVFGILAMLWSSGGQAPESETGRSTTTPGEREERPALAADPRGVAGTPGHRQPALRITGQVREGDRPVRARVERIALGFEAGVGRNAFGWMGPPSMGPSRAVDVTDAGDEGRFTFPDVGEGRFLVVAVSGSGARGWSMADTRPAPRDGASPNVVVFVRGGTETLRGRVRIAGGAPWRGSVGVADRHPASWSKEAFPLQPTDAEGRFEVTGLPPGPAWVVLFEEDHARYEGRSVVLPHRGELEILLPASGPEIRCVVRDGVTETPVPGARVVSAMHCALDRIGSVIWSATTGADGEARLPVGAAGLNVEATGYEPIWVPTEDRRSEVLVRMRPLHAVDVLVLDAATKSPVEGALVLAFGRPNSTVSRQARRSDASGRCRLVGVPEGTATIVVKGGGWCSAELGSPDAQPEAPWPAALTCEVGGAAVVAVTREVVRLTALSGRVLDAGGRPVVEARIEVVSRAGSAYSLAGADDPALVSGPDGTFAGPVLFPRIEYDLDVRAAGHAPTLSGPVRSAAGEPVVLEVRLEGGRMVSARILEAGTRAPLAGATVTASMNLGSRPEHPGVRWLSRSRISDATGAVRMGPFPRLFTELRVGAAGWKGPAIQSVAGDTPGDIELEIALTRNDLRIAGRVRFEDGTPPRDLSVDLAEAVPGAELDVDEQGRFLAEGLTDGTHLLRFRQGSIKDVMLELPAEAGQVGLEVVLPAPRYRGLSIRVLGPDGGRIGSCSYMFECVDETERARAPKGFLRVPPFAGKAWILFSGATDDRGRPLGWAPTTVGPLTGDGREIEVRMREGRAISGEVVDEEGRGLPGVVVGAFWLMPPTPEDPMLTELQPDLPIVATDASGRFEFHGLDGTPYSVYAEVPKGFASPEAVEVRGGESGVRIVMPRPTDVVVTVVDPAGRPVAGAVVARSAGRDSEPILPTDAAGNTRVAGVSPAVPLGLKVSPPSNRLDLREIPDVGWRRGDPPIVLPVGISVRGIVVDESGKPLPRAAVEAIDADGGHHAAAADAAGRFSFDRLPDGPVEVFATVEKPAHLGSRRVRLSGGTGEARLVVRSGVTLRVRVEGTEGDLEGEEVELSSTDGTPADASADIGPGGVAVFEGLDPKATYSFLFSIEEPRPLLGLARDVRGDAGAATIRLEPPQTLVGWVRGAPRNGYVRVSIEEHGVSRKTPARSDGAFALEGVPSGPFTVRARCDAPTGLLVGAARGSAAERVEIVLAPAPAGRR